MGIVVHTEGHRPEGAHFVARETGEAWALIVTSLADDAALSHTINAEMGRQHVRREIRNVRQEVALGLLCCMRRPKKLGLNRLRPPACGRC
jgi:hypothetical protein